MQQRRRSVSSRIGAAVGAVLLVVCALAAGAAEAHALPDTSSAPCSATATSVTCNLPPGNNDAIVEDDGTPGNNTSKIVSGNGTFPPMTFTNPSQSLTINGGGSNDNLTLTPADSFNSADVTIESEGLVQADSLQTTGTLRITSGAIDQPAGALTLGALGANTATGVVLGRANSIGTFAGSVSGPGSGVSLTSSSLSIGTVSASGSFVGASGVRTNRANVSLRADSLKIVAPVVVGSARLTLAPASAGLPVNLGGTPAGALGLTKSALANVTAGTLQVGSPSAGDISISSPMTADGHFASLSLQTGGGVVAEDSNGETDLTVPNLAITSATGVASAGSLNTSISSLAFSNGSGNVNIDDAGALTLGSVDGLDTSSTGGNATISAASDATVQTGLSAGGSLTLNCGTSGADCSLGVPAGGLSGTPVVLSGGPGNDTFNVADETLSGAGPLIIDGGSSGTSTANLSDASVTSSPDTGLILDHLASVLVTGGSFTDNAQDGILIENSSDGTIGGTDPDEANTISDNGADGIRMVSGSGMQFLGNSISGNGQLGIGLESGANGGQSAPTLTFAAPDGTSTDVSGSLQGAPDDSFRLEFFDNPACDSSGFGEGQTLLGSATVTTDDGGNGSFDLQLPGSSAIGDAIAATATDEATGDTSEFSSCLQQGAPTVSIGSPADGATYKLHQSISSSFTCTDGADGPGISSCTDQDGNPQGGRVDTSSPGQYAFTVTATSLDGQTTTQTVSYTVSSPNNHFKLSHKQLNPTTGVVKFDVAVPGAGTVKVLETMLNSGRQFDSGRAHASAHGKRTLHIKVNPNGRGLRLVHHHQKLVSLQLVVTFTPSGGTPHSVRFTLSLRPRSQPVQPASSGARLRSSGSAA